MPIIIAFMDSYSRGVRDEEAFKGYYTPPAKKREKLTAKAKAKRKLSRQTRLRGESIAWQLYQTIDHFFPELFEHMREIEDCRRRGDYELAELITACIALFIFKQGSRNAFNNQRQEHKFKSRYRKLFKLRLPHMDTVNAVMKVLKESGIEQLKTELVKGLLAKKVLRRYRLFGQYYKVVIDGTHVMDVPEGHCPHC